MRASKREIGQWGEAQAAGYLQAQGYSILARNLYFRVGEIDLVALRNQGEGAPLVFIEVKTRTSPAQGYPEEAFTRRKYDHLLAAVESYLQAHPELDQEWQIDVIAVLGSPGQGEAEIRHFQGIVMPNERER